MLRRFAAGLTTYLHQLMETDQFDVFAIVLAVCEQQDSLCMDVPTERLRLTAAITAALHEAELLAPVAQ